MKQLIAPGKTIDVVTPAELVAELERVRSRQVEERPLRTSENVKTDAAGNATLDQLYVVPAGFELVLTRWIIPNVDGSTPGTLFTSAAGWVELIADEQRVDWIPLTTGIAGAGIPNKLTWSEGQGPLLRNLQRLGMIVAGGPVSTNIETRVQGVLRRAESLRGRSIG